jgi:hypothetical protein
MSKKHSRDTPHPSSPSLSAPLQNGWEIAHTTTILTHPQRAAAGLEPQRKRFFRALVSLLEDPDLEIVICSVLLLAMYTTDAGRDCFLPHVSLPANLMAPDLRPSSHAVHPHPAFFWKTTNWAESSSAREI